MFVLCALSQILMYGFVMDFAMNIDKLNLANLVGEVMDKIVEFQICLFVPASQIVKKWVKQALPTNLPGCKCQNVKMSLQFADIMMSKFHVSQP